MLRLQFLGPITIQKEDGSFDHTIAKGAKRLSLLVYLVLAKPKGYHRRDELLALFWPDSGKKRARNSLSNILYHIREALGKDVILNRGDEEVFINSEKIWCDVLAFGEAINKNEFENAFQLYKSEFLSGFHVENVSNDFQDWLDNQRKRLRDECIKVLWELVRQEKEKNNLSKALQYAKRAKELALYSDINQQRYIRFLVDIGKNEEAKVAYKLYGDLLKSEYDIEPPTELYEYISKAKPEINKESSSDANESIPGEIDDPIKEQDSHVFANTQSNISEIRNGKSLFKILATLIIFILGIWYIGRGYFDSESYNINDKSVAVLPFTYINSPDSTDYFSLGVTEEILSRLARINDLSVISRTSVMQYLNSQKSIQVIAKELGVSKIVEGSVQKHQNQVRITAQLIDANNDRHLWGNTYDREIENILTIQSEVATQISEALQTELLQSDQTGNITERNVNEEAYHLYLQAKNLLDIREPIGVVESIDLYKESIAHDSTFAPAYGELALATLYSGLLSRFDYDVTNVKGIPLNQAVEQALEISERSIALDSTVVEAHLSQALIFEWARRDWGRSERSFLKALSINPNHSDVRREYGFHLLRMGDIEEALIHMEKAVSVDPLSWAAHHGLGYTYFCAREYEKAIRELQTSINLGSLYPNTKKHLSLSLLKLSQELFDQDRDEQAIALIETGSTILDEIWGSDTGWKETVIFAATGDSQNTLQSIKNNPLPFPPHLYSLLLIGEKDSALKMLSERLNFSRDRAYVDPIFDTVRNDPRFKKIVEEDLGRQVNIDYY